MSETLTLPQGQRAIVMRMLPDGRCCIHWYIRDDNGPITTPKGEPIPTPSGMWQMGGVRGRIACNPKQNCVTPQQQGNDTLMCLRSDDVRAVTCPKCLETDEAKVMLEHYKTLETAMQNPEAVRQMAASKS